MADPQEETVGEAVGEPRQEKEYTPISQTDVVKENSELPESLVEIGGKEKEDLTFNNTASRTGNGESAVTSSEEANGTNRPSPSPQESSLSDGVREGGQVQGGATPAPLTEEEHSSFSMHSIQETFLSFVGLGSRSPGRKSHSLNVPRAEAKVGIKSEEAVKLPRVAEEVPQSTETESAETPQKGQTEESAATGEHMQTNAEDAYEGIPEFAEDAPNTVDVPKTEVESGIVEQVDTAKTDDALETQGRETEASQKFTETNEAQAGAVSEADGANFEEKSDEAQGVEGAERSIPTSTADINEAHERSGAEVPKDAIFKADGTTERDGEGKSPKASKVVAPFYKVVAKVAEVVEKVVSKEGNSAAGAGEATLAAKDTVEPRRIEEGINSQEFVAAPSPPLVEQEQGAVEADGTIQPKSFFGVVLKHVVPNGKLSAESLSMGNRNSSNVEGSDNVDKFPDEVDEKEHVALLPAATTEKETISGDADPNDISQGKESTQIEADEASNVEAKSDSTIVDSTKETGVLASGVEENRTPPPEVSRELPGGASEEAKTDSTTSSDTLAALEAVSTELPKNSVTGISNFAEEGTVVDSTKETGVLDSEVEENRIPPPEVSREFAGGASEEAKSDSTTSSDTPAVLEAVSTEFSKNSATGTSNFAEEGTVVDSTKGTGVLAAEVDENRTPPPEVPREFPGGASEEAKTDSTTSSDTPAVLEAVSTELPKNSAAGTSDFAEEGTVVDSTNETRVLASEVEENRTPLPEVSREFPGGASEEAKSDSTTSPDTPAVLEAGNTEFSKYSAIGTSNFAEEGTVVDPTKETGVLASEVEENRTPPPEISREFPGGASEEAKSDSTTSSDTPAVLEAVSTEFPKNSATETSNFAEEGTVVDPTKETGVLASEVEENRTPPAEVSREFPGGVSEEGKSPKVSGVVAPFYKVVAKLAEVVENKVSPEEQGKIPNEISPEEKPEEAAETNQEEDIPQEGSKEAEDTSGQVSEEIFKGAIPKDETSLPVKTDVREDRIAELDASALEKQPSLRVNIPKQGQAVAANPETREEETAENLSTPRGTPLMQRVEHLEQKLAQLENRQSPRVDFASRPSTPRSSVDRLFKFSTRYILEETGSKGTLVDRVAALEQKLAHINLHPQSPSNDQSTPSISTLEENSSTEPDSKPAESETRESSPSATDDKAPEDVKSEEAARATEDPLNSSVEQNAPKDLPAQAQPVASQKTSRSNSLIQKKVKAKAAAGKIKGLFAGCFHPKKGKTVSSTAS